MVHRIYKLIKVIKNNVLHAIFFSISNTTNCILQAEFILTAALMP